MASTSRSTTKSARIEVDKEWAVPQLKKVSLTELTATGINPGNDGVGGHTLS